MKRLLLSLLFVSSVQLLSAQEDSTGEKGGFKKENLFTGGSISLSFGSGITQVGVNPMFGYSLTKWADAGVVVNYIYTGYRYYPAGFEKSRSHLYGGGAFARVFPLRFVFAQGQIEHNFISQKLIPYNGGENITSTYSATSFLVGPGYTTGRQPGGGGAYGYLSVLWDLMNDKESPYVELDSNGDILRRIPIIRAGFIIPLFQGGSRDY